MGVEHTMTSASSLDADCRAQHLLAVPLLIAYRQAGTF